MTEARKAGKGSKKLARAARQAARNRGLRSHHIATARHNHVKNALKSCGKEFAEGLKFYYEQHPIISLGKRAGKHRGTSA